MDKKEIDAYIATKKDIYAFYEKAMQKYIEEANRHEWGWTRFDILKIAITQDYVELKCYAYTFGDDEDALYFSVPIDSLLIEDVDGCLQAMVESRPL